jgi:hypothetical protein
MFVEVMVKLDLKNENCFTFIDYQIHVKRLGGISVAVMLTSALNI